MMPRILVTIGIVLYALAVPILEINDTHVFNPEWAPHARLHEVWQLVTNTAFGLLSLWLTWFRSEVKMPAAITCLVTGGFLAAYLLRDGYGGSMVLSNGAEKTLLGLNLGVVAFTLAIALAVLALLADGRSSPPPRC